MTELPAGRPNVLLITVDQWRGECLSALGHPLVRTPNLDRLAAQGVLFARHYAQAAPCGPSRASLHTGTYLANHRSTSNGTPLDARFTNVALELRALGYTPALFGYTDTTPDPRGLAPADPRLRTYEGVLPGFDPVVHLPEEPLAWFEWLAARRYDPPGRDVPWQRWHDAVPGPDGRACARWAAEHSEAAFLVDSFVGWARWRADHPWFAHLAFIRPHPPFVAPAPYHALVDPADVAPPRRAATIEQEVAVHPFLAGAVRSPHVRNPVWEADVAGTRATYFGMMAEVDAQLGRLWDHLVATGEWDRTVVVLTSDHGEQLGDHWLWGKLGWFDGSYHVPLVVRDPRPLADAARGTVVRRFTENVDVLPTLLALLDAPVPLQCDGQSLVPFLHGPGGDAGAPAGWRTEVHWEFDFRFPGGPDPDACSLAVLRDDRGKYVHFAALPPVFHDLVEDPGETVDRAADPACASTVLDYAQRMLTWRLRIADRMLSRRYVGPGGVQEL